LTVPAVATFPPIPSVCWPTGPYAGPDGPAEKWFKKFSGRTVCGEGELLKTFLQPGQIGTGEEMG